MKTESIAAEAIAITKAAGKIRCTEMVEAIGRKILKQWEHSY